MADVGILGEGFFGWNYSTSAAMNYISESEDMGANSLTPPCPGDDDTDTCDNLTNYMPQFDVAAARLNDLAPGLKLNSSDVFILMSKKTYYFLYDALLGWKRLLTASFKKWPSSSSMFVALHLGLKSSPWTNGSALAIPRISTSTTVPGKLVLRPSLSFHIQDACKRDEEPVRVANIRLARVINTRKLLVRSMQTRPSTS